MFNYANIEFTIKSHNHCDWAESDEYTYVGRAEEGYELAEVSFLFSDGILSEVFVYPSHFDASFLNDEKCIGDLKKLCTDDMIEKDVEAAVECGRTIHFN